MATKGQSVALWAGVCSAISAILVSCGGHHFHEHLSTAALKCKSTHPSFCVAEVKPHYQCARGDTVSNAKTYVNNVVNQSFGLIALIQFEIQFPLPPGYTAFGAGCASSQGKDPDPVVVLVDEIQFTLEEAIGNTTLNDYAAMPFVSGGTTPIGSLSNCVSDPNKTGTRGYAGAVLQQTSTGKEFCVVSGTFPHCRQPWNSEFVKAIRKKCSGKELLVIADTNAACEKEGPDASKLESMTDISDQHHAGWGFCSDPAIAAAEAPTCCNDLSYGIPYATYWYDRTALCSSGNTGGKVQEFQVKRDWVCGTDEEHHFTSAIVTLGDWDIEIA